MPRERRKQLFRGRSRATSGVAKEAYYTYTGLVTGEIPKKLHKIGTIEQCD